MDSDWRQQLNWFKSEVNKLKLEVAHLKMANNAKDNELRELRREIDLANSDGPRIS